MSASIPRQAAPSVMQNQSLAGTSSMGMSGVNAHLLMSSSQAVPVMDDKVRPIAKSLGLPRQSLVEAYGLLELLVVDL